MFSNSNWLRCLSASGVVAVCSFATVYLFYSFKVKPGGKENYTKESNEKKSYKVGDSHPYTLESVYDNCIYLDYNATTPVFPEVYYKMVPFLTTCFGNPSSSHTFSLPCREGIVLARRCVGLLINSPNSKVDIIFTSCGTESDNRAIDIALFHYFKRQKPGAAYILPNVIASAIEHPAVLCYLHALVLRKEITLTVIPVDGEGFVNLPLFKAALSPNTALVTIMHSNNEVGTIQPIREIAQSIRLYNQKNQSCVLFHSDGAQSLGKVLIDVQALGVDMFTIVGHKYGAPKGIAALYLRENITATPMLFGGGQERGIRSGCDYYEQNNMY